MTVDGLEIRPILTVHLLGTFTIQQGENLLTLPASGIARSVLAFIFYHRKQVHLRSVLAGIFWPDSPEQRARRALSQVIWHIRRFLPDLLGVSGQEISLASCCPVQVDLEDFENLTSTANSTVDQLRQAVCLYRGDLLEGNYDDWVLMERGRIRERYLLAVESLVQLERAAGNYQNALDLGLKLIKADPLHEAAHREVMRLHHYLGHPEAALRQFEVCRNIFSDELGTAPASETMALAEEIARQGQEISPSFLPKALEREQPVELGGEHPIPITLVGRQQERSVLLRCLETTVHGQGGVILVEGEAGVGKSRLLQEIARDAEWRNLQVIWGYGHEFGATRPFGLLVEALESGLTPLRCDQLAQIVDRVWLQALSSLLPALSQQFPDLESLPALPLAEENTRRIEAIANLLIGWSQAKELVLILEDLHWADQDTLNLLPALASRLGDSGVLIIGSLRSEEARARPDVWDPIQALDRVGLRLRIQVPRLDLETCSELVRRCLGLGRAVPVFEKRIHRETDGNPLFVLETLRSLQDDGLLRRDESGTWHTPWDETTADYVEIPLPGLVERVISRRLAGLNTLAREALNAASVLGNQIDFKLFASLSEMDTARLLEVMRELVKRHFLEEKDDGYHFSHDKIIQVVYDEMDTVQRLRLHGAVLRYLEQHCPHDWQALAHHSLKARLWEKAIRYNLVAGETASSLSADQKAVQHFTKALEALDKLDLPDDDSQRLAALLAREAANNRLGERQAQKADLQALDRLIVTPADRTLQALRWAKYHEVTSNYQAAIRSAQQAIELASRNNDLATVSSGQILWGRALNMQANASGAETVLEDALRNARLAGKTSLTASCLIALARMYYDHQNRYAQALECSQQALTAFREQGNREEEANALNLICSIVSDLGELDRSIQERLGVLSLRRELGDRRGEAMTLYNLAVSYRDKRDFARSLEHIRASLAIAGSIGESRLEAYCRTYLGLLLEESHPDESLEQYQCALRIRRQIGQHALAVDTLAGLARASLRLKETQAARKYISEALEWVEQHGTFAVGDILLVYLAAYHVFCSTNEEERAQKVIQAGYNDLMTRAATLPDESARQKFLETVSQNREILVLYRRLQSSQREVSLPSANQPDRTVSVRWTITAPEDGQITGKVRLRRHCLERLLQEAGEQGAMPTYQHLADALGVGLRTIERDMSALKEMTGKLP